MADDNMNSDLGAINGWLILNGLALNPNKSKAMGISRKINVESLDIIVFNGVTIQQR